MLTPHLKIIGPCLSIFNNYANFRNLKLLLQKEVELISKLPETGESFLNFLATEGQDTCKFKLRGQRGVEVCFDGVTLGL